MANLRQPALKIFRAAIQGFFLLLSLFLISSCAAPASDLPPAASPTPTVETPSPTPTTEACIPSGDQRAIQSALQGAGSAAVLCQGAIFELYDTIYFTAEDQKIYTQGFPTDDRRALLRVRGEQVESAIRSENGHDRVVLSHLIIDGNRPGLGSGQRALIELGGASRGHIVEWVRAYEPRGWSILHLSEGHDLRCRGAIARFNEFGPGGHPESGMADGISLSCAESIIEHNTIFDVTDGGIVIFQAPGTRITGNTIRADSRIMFYGISMVDYEPWGGNFEGTLVSGNTIEARGALIRRGISMGPYVGCIPPEEMTLRSRGAIVSDNLLLGDQMGYGFAISGVEDWTVTSNRDLSTHLAPTRTLTCFGEIVDVPAGFQLNPATSSGDFQAEYQPAVLTFTHQWWPADPLVDISCLEALIGVETLASIRRGERGPLWDALRSTPQERLIAGCTSIWPASDPNPIDVEPMIGIHACEPYCAELRIMNLSPASVLDLSSFELVIEGFRVDCLGLPTEVRPWEEVSCIIDDAITDGFQVIAWQGAGAGRDGWGYQYPMR